MKRVECWRHRDPERNCIWRTTLDLTEQEAARYPCAQRIEGTRSEPDPEQPRPQNAAPAVFNAKSRQRRQAA
jgi:hypothetical protein